jgi:hypothetical protein
MFIDQSHLLRENPLQLNYGIAITDVDNDGAFEAVVAGFGCPNLALKWIGSAFVNIADETLADAKRQAIGLAACDIDNDGAEELYILNTDTFGGEKRFGDKLFDYSGGEWVDLFALPMHQHIANLTAGRSVICLDRKGDGRYGFFVANYGGPLRLYEMDDDGVLDDVASQAGLALVTNGRGAVAAPLLSQHLDIFAANENDTNFLFLNRGDGTFEEIAALCGLGDPYEHGRGIAVLDADGDGRLDIVYGNWEGKHRLFMQASDGVFRDTAPLLMAMPSRVRTVIAADFDNDGYEEIFFNNIGESNRLFGYRNGKWESLPMGAAREPYGLGTGAAVADFDGDSRLELLIAHGESGFQPLSLYKPEENDHQWLRVLPLTEQGAPARGAVVRLISGERTQIRVIDGGSGYLCQMEPVAHFGLGATPPRIECVEIRWPSGKTVTLDSPNPNQLIRVPYPQ